MNKLKLGLAALIGAAGIAGFYYLYDSPLVVRVILLLSGILLSAVIAFFTVQGRDFYKFSRDSVDEVRKVVWPDKKQTLQTAGIVCAFVMVMAFFLWLIDASLMGVIKYVMDQEI